MLAYKSPGHRTKASSPGQSSADFERYEVCKGGRREGCLNKFGTFSNRKVLSDTSCVFVRKGGG